MKISFRFIYLLPLVLIISTDTLFIQMGIVTYKPVIVLFTLLPFIFINDYSPFMKRWFFIYVIYLAVLCAESYYYYNTPLKYLHVSAKVMVCFSIFSMYGFYRRFGHKVTIKGLLFIILVGFLANSIIVNARAFTIGAFLNNDRGLASESVYLLIIPVLYNFNQFIRTNNIINMLSCFALFGVILFLQHRTVWVSLAFAGIVNILLMPKANLKFRFVNLILASSFVALIGITLATYVLTDEEVTQRIQVSIDQLTNPTGSDKDDEVSTSEWRYMQFQSYWPYVLDQPFLGMRFKGYELPIQFYDHNGLTPFEDGTGHHFHSFYLDRLFYQGFIGLLLLTLPLIIRVFFFLKTQKTLSLIQLIMLSYISSALVFGLSYNWPEYIYGLIGFCFAYLDERPSSDTESISEVQEMSSKIEYNETIITK